MTVWCATAGTPWKQWLSGTSSVALSGKPKSPLTSCLLGKVPAFVQGSHTTASARRHIVFCSSHTRNYSFWNTGSSRVAISVCYLVAVGHPCAEDTGALAWSRAVFLVVSPGFLAQEPTFQLVSTRLTTVMPLHGVFLMRWIPCCLLWAGGLLTVISISENSRVAQQEGSCDDIAAGFVMAKLFK